MNKAIKTSEQLYFNKDHELVRRAVRDFINKEINPHVDEWEEAGIAPLKKLFKKKVNFLKKDKEVLLTFYEFPAEHWRHIRTTNPIESTFATIRLRHRKTKGNGTRRASLAMMFKLAQSASKKWRRLNCHEKISFVIEGRSFKDGIMQEEIAA